MVTAHATPLRRLSQQLGELAANVQESVVSVRDLRHGSGAGFVWATDTIITNHHVVPGDEADIIFANGHELKGRVIDRDPQNDIAVLKVSGAPRPATIGDSTQLRIGEIVMAIGHPMGVEDAISVGIVSGLPTPCEPRAMIRSDLHLLPGNSGGPLLTADGCVVGVNAMVAGHGTAFSVPERTVRALLARLSGQDVVLGLSLSRVPVPRSSQDSVDGEGGAALLVSGVEPGGPADQAGVYPGDILVAVGDDVVQHPLRVREALLTVAPDRPVSLGLIRGGKPIRLEIQLRSAR